jgi:TRAP-type C4-dicarboxylate transport system substrate-binding protein
MFLWQPYMVTDRHAYHAFLFAVNGDLWAGLSGEVRRVIEDTFAEVRDFQRALSGRVDGEFVRMLGEKGVKVHAPTPAEMNAWRQATANVYDDTRMYLGGTRVAEMLQFRRDWDAGKYTRQEQAYVERFANLQLPVEECLRHFQ